MTLTNDQSEIKGGEYPEPSTFYQQAFARNIGLISEEEQHILRKARIAIPGLGGVGGVHLMTLARTGIGGFHLADFDTFSLVNFNRQYGAGIQSLERPKLETMIEEALNVNPYLEIDALPEGITPDNIGDFLRDVDVVVDGIDFFEFDIRRLLFKAARERGIPVITAGPMGFSSALLVFLPDKGMGFDEFFDIRDDLPEEDKYLHYALGLAPRGLHIGYMDKTKVSLSEKVGPSSVIACQLCAGMAATEVLRLILGRKGVKGVPHYYQFDPYLHKYARGYLWLGNRNPLQKLKKEIIKNFILK